MKAFNLRIRDAAPWLSICFSLAYFFCFIRIFSRYAIDDAYIHLRIARNILSAGAPYFNAREAVMGSSPHLWIVLLALLLKLGSGSLTHLPDLAFLLTFGTFVLLISLLRKRFSFLASTWLAFALVTVFLLSQATGLMEAPLTLCLFLASARCAADGRPTSAGLLAGLALGARYELCLWAFFAFLLAFAGRSRWRFFLGFAFPAIGYLAYTLAFFGTVVPFPMIAKARLYSISAREFLELIAPTVLREWPPGFAWLVGVLLAALGVFAIKLLLQERAPGWIKAILASSLALLAIFLIRRTFMFSWYWPLVTLPLALALLVFPTRRKTWALAAFTLVFSRFIFAAALDAYALASGHHEHYEEYATGLRVGQYLHIGAALYRWAPGARLLTSEIGALGWAFPGEIIDGGALVTPGALKFHPMPVPADRPAGTVGAIPVGAVAEFSPDLIVSMPVFSGAIRREMRSHRLPGYSLLATYPVIPPGEAAKSSLNSLWGSRVIEIFVRDQFLRR